MTATNPRARAQERLVHGFAVPANLERLAAEIEASRALLSLEDDWDEAGSPGYAEETWRRAIGLLIWISRRLWDDHGSDVEGVDVLPGSRGNVDFEIRVPNRRLLISVPADPAAPIRFFGQDTVGAGTTKGNLDLNETPTRLVGWLAA
jgi:hypothetical protein